MNGWVHHRESARSRILLPVPVMVVALLVSVSLAVPEGPVDRGTSPSAVLLHGTSDRLPAQERPLSWESGSVPTGSNASTSSLLVAVTFTLAVNVYAMILANAPLPNCTLAFDGSPTSIPECRNVTFQVPSGSYPYRLTPVPGWTADWSGTVDVPATPVDVTIDLNVTEYPVTFHESGLAAGTNWTILVGVGLPCPPVFGPGGPCCAPGCVGLAFAWGPGPTHTLDLPNGTLGWESSAGGYLDGSGQVAVAGSPPGAVRVAFEPMGELALEAIGVLEAVGVALAVTVIVIDHRRRRRDPRSIVRGSPPRTVG